MARHTQKNLKSTLYSDFVYEIYTRTLTFPNFCQGEFTSVTGDSLSGDWGDFGSYFPGTGTNWGGVLNGMGIAKYRANAKVALRALSTGLLTPAQVGSAGGTYEGDWKDGKQNGKGTEYFADGGRYEGEFKDDQANGKGT